MPEYGPSDVQSAVKPGTRTPKNCLPLSNSGRGVALEGAGRKTILAGGWQKKTRKNTRKNAERWNADTFQHKIITFWGVQTISYIKNNEGAYISQLVYGRVKVSRWLVLYVFSVWPAGDTGSHSCYGKHK